jgi:murein tripeptide amidase MpaA
MKSFVFHIIPMINPDGVIMGNFRTSLYGKDLNRLFSKSQTLMIPEVEFCRSLMNSLWRKHKNRLAMFLDIHGHSVRRNSFCYGPGIGNANSF